jgi:TorA maturation chaperone TorD
MQPMSSQHIRALAGRFDSATLAEVLRLNPTEDELAEALGWLEGGDADEPAPHPSQARTMALFALLADALEDESIEDEETETY